MLLRFPFLLAFSEMFDNYYLKFFFSLASSFQPSLVLPGPLAIQVYRLAWELLGLSWELLGLSWVSLGRSRGSPGHHLDDDADFRAFL